MKVTRYKMATITASGGYVTNLDNLPHLAI